MGTLHAPWNRRDFLTSVGKGLGLATLASPVVGSLLDELHAATKATSHLTPFEAARDEDFWFEIQRSFSITRGITNLNNGGVSPSPRIVTEAFVRYIWQQEDVTAYTMWQILEPQSETIRTGLAEEFGCDQEEIAITRNVSDGLEAILFGLDLKAGDEVLTTTQDYPRMLNTLKQRQRRDGVILKMISIPTPPKSLDEITAAFEKAITPKTRVILICHMINLTGQILPVKDICRLGRSKGIDVVVDGAHSFAHLDFKLKDLDCDFFATSLHKWFFAPKGTGFLYVKKDKIPKVWPLMAADEKQDGDIRKFEEIGTHPAAPRLAIGEALLYHRGIGPKRKEERMRYLKDHWVNQLKDLPNVRFHTSMSPDQSCGLANIEVMGIAPGAIGSYLMDKHKIFTTPIVHPEFKGIRVTPSVYTTIPELDRFCGVMADVAKKGLPK
ncbi:MAG: aminotransferase class V-fold PLP-dependent enzyme [Bacteroidetes bacterium]|jgi:selenocysteine lyase/cysteine desulfurase|nr:aminotransferase class V-fold PLP-dependent enzyme [Bacteroidota bacterium]